MKPFWIGLAATIAAALLSLAPSPCSGQEAGAADTGSTVELAAPDTPRLAIERAREEGRIGFAEEMLLKAYSLYAPERLPEEYRRPDPEKCGTPLAREIEKALPGLPADVAAEITRLRARPTNWDSYLNTTHFRIFYSTSGPDMILGWPDTSYRDAVAAAAENSWTEEVSNMGFRQPPDDSSDPDGGGGSSHYDIYVQNLGSGFYGWCSTSYTVPSTPRTDATSYISIDNDYAGFGYPDATDPMKVTVAHEFCHACQFSSNYLVPSWYAECTSVWSEDEVYDSINDYLFYLPYYFNYPYASIEWNDGTGARIYGSCVWNIFISEAVAATLVPDVWARLESTSDEFAALDYCLGLEGSSLEEAFGTFAVWNWFTGSRNDGAHYSEGATWPLVSPQATYGMYPVVDGGPSPGYYPDHLAWNYVHLNNPGFSEDALDVAYDGPAPGVTPNRAFVNLKTTGGATSEHGELTLDMMGQGVTTITDWDDFGTIAVVIVNTSTGADNMTYTVDADKYSPVAGSFYAAVNSAEAVTLRWTLADPWEILSLDVLRSTDGGVEYERLNTAPLAPATPGSYVDTDVRPGEELWYKLVATLTDGSEDVVSPGVAYARIDGTLGLSLSPPMPNPFGEAASFEFTVPQNGGLVTLTVYDVAGRAVRTLVSGSPGRGRHTSMWDGADDRGHAVAAGVYFVTLEVPGGVVAQKAMLLR
jgi:hypothetical protein